MAEDTPIADYAADAEVTSAGKKRKAKVEEAAPAPVEMDNSFDARTRAEIEAGAAALKKNQELLAQSE